MDLWREYKVILTPYFIIIILIFWTLFTYVLGSMYYKCECEKTNLVLTLHSKDYAQCLNKLNNPLTGENISYYNINENGSVELITK